MPIRYDAATLAEVREDGLGIKCDAVVTRTGIFEYRNPDGTRRREYRPESEVFREDSMSTFDGKPVTIGHQGLVTSATWPRVAVGHMGTARREGENITTPVHLFRQDAIDGVKAKRYRAVSVGYEVDYDPTPGTTPAGERYDGIQRNYRVNHLALLATGVLARAGDVAQLRLDSAGDEICGYTTSTMPTQEEFDALKRANDELEKKNKEQKTRLDSLDGKVAGLTSQLEEKTKDKDAERFDSAVEERLELIDQAKKVLGREFTGKGKTNRDIKVAIVNAKMPKVRLDSDSSDEYIDGLLEGASALPHPSMSKTREDAREAQRPAVNKVHAAQDRNRQASQDAWKGAGK